MKITIVDFTGGSDGVYAIYIDGILHKYGDDYHNKIRIYFSAFIEGIEFTNQVTFKETIVCNNQELIEDISENGNTPPKHLTDIKIN